MTAHTRGPWFITNKPESLGVIAHTGGCIAFTAIPRKVNQEREEGESWLDMRDRTQAERESVKQEEAANARLIAAAPELLEELESAFRLLDAIASLDFPDAMSRIERVIAKAKGESDGR